jgi:hypothetical protein
MNFARIGLWLPYPKPFTPRTFNGSAPVTHLGIQIMTEVQTQEKYSFARVEGDTIFQPGDHVAFDLVWKNFLNSDDGQFNPTNIVRALAVTSFARWRITGWTYQLYDAALAAKLEEIKGWWTAKGRQW